MQAYETQYRDELLQNVLPFWSKHSIDKEYGGFFCSFERDGTVYDTDKWVWLQGRAVWTFATMCGKIEKRPEWLEAATQGAEFLRRFGRDDQGAYYFGLTREGQPLVQPYNIFSDCFAAMGYGALAGVMPGSDYGTLAKSTFETIMARRDNPKGKYSKLAAKTRPLKSFALTMILCNLALELEPVLGADYIDSLVRGLADEIMGDYYKPEFKGILENIALDGSFVDSYEGRTFSPGHTLESMWFLMDIGERLKDEALIRKAVDVSLEALEHGWDKEFGGLFYFMDVREKYPLQLEFDQKLWWVHLEALVTCAKGYMHTRDPRLADWFEKLHVYTWSHFKDPDYPEWYGYLNRRGEVLLPIKGGKWKGCFHLPRALLQLWKTNAVISNSKDTGNRPITETITALHGACFLG
jgi:N-acylglucosamine 2-epimerase